MNAYIETEQGLCRLPSYKVAAEAFVDRWSMQTHVTVRGNAATVSTVFLVFDHNFSGKGPPLLYETMVFGVDGGNFCRRYCTRTEAVAGHEEVARLVETIMHDHAVEP